MPGLLSRRWRFHLKENKIPAHLELTFCFGIQIVNKNMIRRGEGCGKGKSELTVHAGLLFYVGKSGTVALMT